jgi:hypothetical protein
LFTPPLSVVGVSNNWFQIEMRVHLKEMGAGIWKDNHWWISFLEEKSKFAAQREGKKNDALALKTILSGLSSPIKESIGQCTSRQGSMAKARGDIPKQEGRY